MPQPKVYKHSYTYRHQAPIVRADQSRFREINLVPLDLAPLIKDYRNALDRILKRAMLGTRHMRRIMRAYRTDMESRPTESFMRGDGAEHRLDNVPTTTMREIDGLEIDAWNILDGKPTAKVIEGKLEALSNANAVDFTKQYSTILGLSPKNFDDQTKAILAKSLDINISKVKSIGTLHHEDLRKVIAIGYAKGTSYDEMAKEISQRFGVTERRGHFIAWNEIGNLNSELSQHRQTKNGITHYKWSTSMDERVRPTHVAKEGKIFAWAEPPPDTGHAGRDYRCRCVPQPLFDESLFDVPEPEMVLPADPVQEIRDIRADLSISQRALAQDLGRSQAWLSGIEQGKSVLPDDAKRNLAAYFHSKGIDPERLRAAFGEYDPIADMPTPKTPKQRPTAQPAAPSTPTPSTPPPQVGLTDPVGLNGFPAIDASRVPDAIRLDQAFEIKPSAAGEFFAQDDDVFSIVDARFDHFVATTGLRLDTSGGPDSPIFSRGTHHAESYDTIKTGIRTKQAELKEWIDSDGGLKINDINILTPESFSGIGGLSESDQKIADVLAELADDFMFKFSLRSAKARGLSFFDGLAFDFESQIKALGASSDQVNRMIFRALGAGDDAKIAKYGSLKAANKAIKDKADALEKEIKELEARLDVIEKENDAIRDIIVEYARTQNKRFQKLDLDIKEVSFYSTTGGKRKRSQSEKSAQRWTTGSTAIEASEVKSPRDAEFKVPVQRAGEFLRGAFQRKDRALRETAASSVAQRAYQMAPRLGNRSLINMGSGRAPKHAGQVMLHEMGHLAETQNPVLDEAARRYLLGQITNKSKIQTIPNHGRSEIYITDTRRKFANPYAVKVYTSGSSTSRPSISTIETVGYDALRATELTSMAAEMFARMLDNSAELSRQGGLTVGNEGLVRWMVAVLSGDFQ